MYVDTPQHKNKVDKTNMLQRMGLMLNTKYKKKQ